MGENILAAEQEVSDLEATFAAPDFYLKPPTEMLGLENRLKAARAKVSGPTSDGTSSSSFKAPRLHSHDRSGRASCTPVVAAIVDPRDEKRWPHVTPPGIADPSHKENRLPSHTPSAFTDAGPFPI